MSILSAIPLIPITVPYSNNKYQNHRMDFQSEFLLITMTKQGHEQYRKQGTEISM